jgi:O-antigen ligase
MQSRGSLVGIILIATIYIFIINEKKIKKIIFIFFIFLLPILVWEAIRYQKIQNYKINNSNKNILEQRFISNRFINLPLVEDYNDVSSGRRTIWKKSFELIKNEKVIFGLGPQADRKYLSKNKFNEALVDHLQPFWQNNASNAIIYSYLSAGLFGLISIITIYYLIGKELYYFFYIKNLNNNNIYVQFSSLTLLYLTIRTIFENGYSLFSLDYCFISLCYFILINSREKKV